MRATTAEPIVMPAMAPALNLSEFSLGVALLFKGELVDCGTALVMGEPNAEVVGVDLASNDETEFAKDGVVVLVTKVDGLVE